MTNKVLEVARFKLIAGASAGDLQLAQAAVRKFLDTCSGFLSRRISSGQDGTYLDIVEWDSDAEAKAAAKKFLETPSLLPFMQMIDMATLTMEHREIVWELK